GPGAVFLLGLDQAVAEVGEVFGPLRSAGLKHGLGAVVVAVVGELAEAAVVLEEIVVAAVDLRGGVFLGGLRQAVEDAHAGRRARELAPAAPADGPREAVAEASVRVLSIPDVGARALHHRGLHLDAQVARGAQRHRLTDGDGGVALAAAAGTAEAHVGLV